MEAADLRPLGNREVAGKAKVDLRPLGNREAGKDRPAKVGKTMSMEGKRNAALDFIVRTSKTFSLVASGGRTDGCKVIAHGDGVDVVFVGKMLEHRNCVWIAGDGFESEVKLEDGKTVAYTPPCITKFTNIELEEMSFKQLMCKLAMDPLDILCCALAKAGIPFLLSNS